MSKFRRDYSNVGTHEHDLRGPRFISGLPCHGIPMWYGIHGAGSVGMVTRRIIVAQPPRSNPKSELAAVGSESVRLVRPIDAEGN